MSETLRDLIALAGPAARDIATRDHRLALADFAWGSPFGAERAGFAGRSVVLSVRDMASAAAALIDLDGFARRRHSARPDATMGDILRYPPLRRLADISSRARRPRFADADERRRGDAGFPRPRPRGRRHAYLGNADALAQSAAQRRRFAHR